MVNPLEILRLPLCFLRTNYGRLALTVGALAAGIALVTAIEVVNRSVLQSFEDVIDTMAGRAALQVSAGNGAFFPEEVAERVAAVSGVELAAQVVTATAYLAGGSGELITIHGVDITNDAAIRVYEASGAQRTRLEDPLRFLNQPDSVMLTEELTARHGLRIGDAIELETPVGRRRFTVRALLQPQGIARIHGGNLAVMDLFAAEAAFTTPGLINRLDVVVDRDGDVPRVQAAIAGVLPNGLAVAPPAQRKADLQRVMWAMQTVLRMVALLALGSAFLIAFNRLSTFFEERAWQHGVMRAIGVSQGAVRWELLKEGLVLGMGGVAIGVPLGMALAHGLLPIIATTTAVSARLVPPRSALVLGGWSVPVAAGLGLMTALLAAARPAWRAAGVPVAETVRGRGTEQAGTRRTSYTALLAVWMGTASRPWSGFGWWPRASSAPWSTSSTAYCAVTWRSDRPTAVTASCRTPSTNRQSACLRRRHRHTRPARDGGGAEGALVADTPSVSAGATSFLGRSHAVRAELLAYHLPHHVERRAAIDVREQGVVDQCLVVPATGLIDRAPKVLDHCVVESDRDLRLPRLGLHHGPPARPREVDVTALFSHGLSHIGSSDVCWPSKPK